VYKTIALGNPIACIHMGTTKGTEDRAFVSTAQNIYGFNKKGKEFFKFQSNLAESITKIHTHDSKLWTATDYIYNQYDNGVDKASFMSPDKINDMLIVNVTGHDSDFYAVLGCQDRYLRVIGRDGTLVTKKSVAAPITALTRAPSGGKSGSASGTAQIFYGTSTGAIGLMTFNGEKLKTKWKTSTISKPEGEEAAPSTDTVPSTSGSVAAINSITCFDIDKDDRLEIVIGRDDGHVEVYAFDDAGDVTKLYEYVSTDSVRCVQGGVVSTPGFEEVVATTFSGRVMSFTTEPLDQQDADDSYGRTRGTVHRETRIVKLRKEISQLEEKLLRERDRAYRIRGSEKDMLPVAEDLVVNHSFQLNPTIGAYDVSIEVPMNIQSVVLHSAVPIDLLENHRNLAIVSKSPVDPQNNTHFLATYRCLEPTNRLEFNIRTIEGQFGDVEATVITDGAPKAAQAIRFYVKPLSLHHRVNVVHESELRGPTNALHLSGAFTLLQIHEWVSLCLPEVPSRLQDDDVVMYYKNTYLGNLLVCRYCKGEASFTSPSVSAIAILKEVITKEATARKVTLNLSLDIQKETIPVMLGYLRPLLDAKHALASQVKLIDGIKELQMHEDDYAAWMAPEYQQILMAGDRILNDFKASPKALNYLAGILTDLYVDLCKFRGSNVKQNLPRLYQLIEHYHFDSLVEFYLKE
jgi:Bardet-Biedl syndrome 7 protein